MYFPLILIFFFSYIVFYSDLECIFVAGNAGYVLIAVIKKQGNV